MKVKLKLPLLFLILVSMLPGQELTKVKIAFLDLNPIEISRSSANMISDAFRTELAEVDSFEIIEREAIKEALKKAGKGQLESCISKACAMELLELLQVDRVIFGQLEFKDGLYTINLNMIKSVPKGLMISFQSEGQRELYQILSKTVKKLTQKIVEYREEIERVDKGKDTGVGWLKITSQPDGAEIFLDGKGMGTTPLVFIDLPSKKYLVEASIPTYESASESVFVNKGQLVSVSYNLKPMGRLRIVGRPQGARVFSEDAFMGDLPLDMELPVGDYKLSITENEYREEEREVTILHKEMAGIKVKLEYLGKTKRKAFLKSTLFPGYGQFYSGKRKRGWFFTLVEMGLLTGTALTYGQLRSQSNDYDELNQKYLDAENTEDILKYGELRDQKAQRVNSAYTTFYYVASTTAGIWLYNVFDALFFFPKKKHGNDNMGEKLNNSNEINFGVSVTGNSSVFRLSYNF